MVVAFTWYSLCALVRAQARTMVLVNLGALPRQTRRIGAVMDPITQTVLIYSAVMLCCILFYAMM